MKAYEIRHLAIQNAAALIDAMDLEAFYGDDVYTQAANDEESLQLLESQKQLVLRDIRTLK